MDIDTDKIDETVLALLHLGVHGKGRTWKSFDRDAMQRALASLTYAGDAILTDTASLTRELRRRQPNVDSTGAEASLVQAG